MALVEKPESLIREAIGEPPSSDDGSPPTGRDENTLDREELVTRTLDEASNRMNTDRGSLAVERVAWDPIVEGLVNKMEVSQMMEAGVIKLTDKLDARATQVAEESIIGKLGIIDNDPNIAFV